MSRTSLINYIVFICTIITRGGVEDTRLEAKDTKKIRGQGQPFRGQTLSRPRTGMLKRAKDTSTSALQKKKGLHKNFSSDLHKKTFSKKFSSAPQNFNNSKNSAVLEPRTPPLIITLVLKNFPHANGINRNISLQYCNMLR